MKNKILLNPEPDGTCRTIKANYHKVSVANFVRRGGYGASAVIEYEPVQVDDPAGYGQGLCDVPAEVGVRPELS